MNGLSRFPHARALALLAILTLAGLAPGCAVGFVDHCPECANDYASKDTWCPTCQQGYQGGEVVTTCEACFEALRGGPPCRVHSGDGEDGEAEAEKKTRPAGW